MFANFGVFIEMIRICQLFIRNPKRAWMDQAAFILEKNVWPDTRAGQAPTEEKA
jgi:hypothetical protein